MKNYQSNTKAAISKSPKKIGRRRRRRHSSRIGFFRFGPTRFFVEVTFRVSADDDGSRRQAARAVGMCSFPELRCPKR